MSAVPKYQIERLDHLGIVSGVIKDLGIIELIDEKLGIYPDENISTGEAVAGMIINGLGFSNKPLSLTPLFFENCPLNILFREGVSAQDFNRFKLGRALDRCHGYGTELLFSEISMDVCRREGVDTRFNSLDSTSFSLSGDYLGQTDEDTIEIKLGHSKDHRPDLKQVMLEMMVSHDGGIPLLGKSLDGNSSDNTVFEDRSKRLVEAFKASETPRYLIADCKLYTAKNAVNLKDLPFITRIPNHLNVVKSTIEKALTLKDAWETLADGRKIQTFNIEHYDIEQRWHVVSSDTSRELGEKQVKKRVLKEEEAIKKQLNHLQAKRFNCSDDATTTAQTIAKKWKLHNINSCQIIEHPQYEGKGRPKKGQKPAKFTYQIRVTQEQNTDEVARLTSVAGHYIIGGNIDDKVLNAAEVVSTYQEQNQVEQGFRFLKDPLFFTSSLFVKTQSRIMGLLMVMLLSLLVYGIAQRRMRSNLARQKETLPNQIGQKNEAPTLRWVFQLLQGIHSLKISIGSHSETLMEGGAIQKSNIKNEKYKKRETAGL